MTHYWVKATGTSGTGSGECDAKLFSLTDLNCKLRPTTLCGATPAAEADPPDITIHFLPGTYEIPANTYPGFLEIGGGSERTVVFTGPEPGATYSCSTQERPVLKMGPSHARNGVKDGQK